MACILCDSTNFLYYDTAVPTQVYGDSFCGSGIVPGCYIPDVNASCPCQGCGGMDVDMANNFVCKTDSSCVGACAPAPELPGTSQTWVYAGAGFMLAALAFAVVWRRKSRAV